MSLTEENPINVCEHEVLLSDGTKRWQRWKDHAIFNEFGEIIEFHSVGEDITDIMQYRKDFEDTSQKLEQQKKQLEEKNIALREILYQLEREKKTA